MQEEKDTKENQSYKENLEKSKKSSEEYYRRLHDQIRIEREKNERNDREAEEKLKKVYKKSIMDAYTHDNENDELEVPVDGELERGSRLFMINCASCHGLEPSSGATNKKGPSLGLIYNRKAGSDVDFEAYSNKMVQSQHYWSARNLYKFMLEPQKFLPGNLCKISGQKGLRSEEDRADILVFLREYSKQLGKNIQLKNIQAKGYGLAQTELYVEQQKEKYIQMRSKDPTSK